MIGGGVERVEAVIFVFNFRAVGNDETDFAKAADNVVGDLRERMKFAEPAAPTGKGKVGRIFRHGLFEFQVAAARVEGRFEFGLGDVDEFAGGGFFFLGQSTELFEQGSEFAVGAEVIHARLVERGKVLRGGELGEGGLFQRFDLIEERHK
jgi:hypothetical protein